MLSSFSQRISQNFHSKALKNSNRRRNRRFSRREKASKIVLCWNERRMGLFIGFLRRENQNQIQWRMGMSSSVNIFILIQLKIKSNIEKLLEKLAAAARGLGGLYDSASCTPLFLIEFWGILAEKISFWVIICWINEEIISS